MFLFLKKNDQRLKFRSNDVYMYVSKYMKFGQFNLLTSL